MIVPPTWSAIVGIVQLQGVAVGVAVGVPPPPVVPRSRNIWSGFACWTRKTNLPDAPGGADTETATWILPGRGIVRLHRPIGPAPLPAYG